MALHLLVLHRADGGDVTVNADQITSLRNPAGRLHHLAPLGHCIVYLVDGSFVGVLESCAEVRAKLEQLR